MWWFLRSGVKKPGRKLLKMLYAWTLLAQVAPVVEDEVAKKKDDGPGLGGLLMPLIPILFLFYFLIILPGKKERQQRVAMMSALKRNDKIITNGGIIGVVLNIREGTDEITIKSEDTKLLVLRSSIARIITEPEKEASAQNKPAT